MEHKVGDKTASEVFHDSGLAKLAKAACEGDVDAVQEALQSGADVNGEGYQRTTPLIWALTCDNIDGMEALLKAGANPNQDNGRFSPVFAAATRHDPKPLQLLLRYGGDANAVDSKSGRSALDEALSLGINDYGWGNYYALLDKADVNRPNLKGDTIAFSAAYLNQFDKVAELLLERGYRYKLTYLGRCVETGEVDLEPQKTWRRKVKEILESRGVKFPVGPTNKFDDSVTP